MFDRAVKSGPADRISCPNALTGFPFTIVCIGEDRDCNGMEDGASDSDGDGVDTCNINECDDSDPNRFPGNPDPLGDGIDQDCDGTDGQGLVETPWIAGARPFFAYGKGLTVADINGDGCDDLIVGESGLSTKSQHGLLTPARVHAFMGCSNTSAVQTYEADDGSIGDELQVWKRPDADQIIAISRGVDSGIVHIIDFTTNPPERVGRLAGIDSGDIRDAFVVRGPALIIVWPKWS